MLVGTAEVAVLPADAGFAPALKEQTDAGLREFEDSSRVAGVRSGQSMRDGVKDGASGIEKDMEDSGKRAGSSFSKGIGGGLSKLGSVIESTGLPLGGLSKKLNDAGAAMKDTEGKSGGLKSALNDLGGIALAGVAAAAIGAGVAGVKLAGDMEVSERAIASATGQSKKYGEEVGNAFLSTAGKSRFSGEEMAEAFKPVAAQLQETQGRALTAGESLKFMSAAGDLAEAKGIGLGEATKATASILQAFNLKVAESAHVTDVLYSASNATGVSVESFAQQITRMRARLGETAGSVGELASTIVDLTHQGITGRGAMSALNSGMSTLLKTAGGVTTASKQEQAAYEAMAAPLKALADKYREGTLSSSEFKKVTEKLPPEQAGLVSAFTKSVGAVQTANAKYRELGVEVFNAKGNFVGMGSVIDQLYPRFKKMTEQQQLSTAATIFGAGAARQMTAIINAGPEAYDKATKAVEKHNAASDAAKKYGETLQGEMKTLGATVTDLATKFGQFLIPIVTKFMGVILNATTFVLDHKAVLVALAVLIGGPLTAAITVFTVSKMIAFGNSFVTAGKTISSFASSASASIQSVIAKLGLQEAAAEKSAAVMEESATAGAGAERAEAGAITAATGQMEMDFSATAGAAGTAAGEVGVAAAGEATAVEGADTAIEAANVAAGASFTAMLGPIGAVAAAAYALNEVLPGGDKIENLLGGNQPGESGKEGEVFMKKHPHYLEETQPYNGNSNEQKAMSAIQGTSLSQSVARGVVKVLAAESGKGLPTTATGSEGAYGIAQWLGSRLEGLRKWAGEHHESGNDINTQLQYLVHEFKTSEHGTWEKLKNAKSTSEAESIFVKDFERPESASGVLARSHGYSAPHTAATKENTAALKNLEKVIKEGEQAAHKEGKAKASKGPSEKSITQWAEKAVGHFAENLGHDEGSELNALQAEFHTRAAAWCAEFATTAAMMGGANKAVRTASVATIRQWAEEGSHGYRKGVTGSPQAGDLGMFGDKHVVFIQSVNRAAGTVTAIAGNNKEGSGAVKRQTFKISEMDYARPAYKKVESGGEELKEVSKRFEAAAKAELKKQSSDKSAGEKARNTLEQETQATSLKQFESLATKAHQEGVGIMVKDVHGVHTEKMGSLEKRLDADHSKALEKLSSQLVAVHKKAVEHEAELVAKAAKEAWEKSIPGQVAAWEKSNREQRELEAAKAASPEGKRIAAEEAAKKQAEEEKTNNEKAEQEKVKAAEEAERKRVEAIQKQSKLETDKMEGETTEKANATKVALDKLAERGLAGANEIAAHLQTVSDEITGEQDKLIQAAKIAVDEAAGKGSIAEAEAQAKLSKTEAEAKKKEEEAASAAELAKARANETNNQNNFEIHINGSETSAEEIVRELGWGMKTGIVPNTPTMIPA